MRIRLGKFVIIALGILTVGVLASRAQITNQLGFKMSQAFTVGNTTLPPGSYVVRPVQGTDQQVIEISSAAGKPSVLVDVNSAQPDGSQSGTQLIFNRYKSVLALSQVFPGNGNQGYQLVQGHPEQIAAKTEKPTKQTVTATAK
jgi:hypothetical protein